MQGNIATILRDGMPVNIEEDDLRQGDILLLQAGDLVPADLYLTEARGLQVEEWDLTGELMPVEKRVDGDEASVYRGSRVTRGSGRGVVTAIGDDTEYAKCLKQSWERTQHGLPPLFSRMSLVLLVLILPPLAFTLIRYDHKVLIVLLGVLLAVVLVLMENSDLFDYLVTARETRTIERCGTRIRDMSALKVAERLTVVCLDKTGVMTSRDLRVKEIYLADAVPDLEYFATGEEVARLTRIGCALCNDVVYAEKVGLASRVDRALIAFARTNGTDINNAHQEYRRVSEKPFDSEERYMACEFESSNETLFFAKGDPEIMLQMCESYVTRSGEEHKVDFGFWQSAKAQAETVGMMGDVVIALAYAAGSRENRPLSYVFLCMVRLENPMQPSVPAALRELRKEGIRALMLTGDRSESALKIGMLAGMVANERVCLTGKQIAHMRPWDIGEQATYVSIFARLTPSHKGLVVLAIQQRHEIVAMVGDGANDTVALKVADVGIAFGSEGSPFAKRVSPILINDLTDVVTIVQSAKKVHEQLGELAAIRAVLLVAIYLGLYGWMLLNW